jgi:hypothetical protein
MIETNREQGNGIIPGTVLMSALLREAELWTNAQSEVLSFTEAAITGRMDRWREAVDNWSRSFQRLCDCRNAVDCVQTLQDWLRNAVHLATTDMRALTDDARTLTRRTSAAFQATGDNTERHKDVVGAQDERPEAGGSRVDERIAAE